MASGRVELVSTGIQDQFVTDAPTFTYFHSQYKRHTRFAMDTLINSFTGEIAFGSTLRCIIPRKGDLIKTIYVKFNMPFLANADTTDGFGYVDSIGHAVLEYAELYIGGQLVDRITSDIMEIHSELFVDDSHQNSLTHLVGKTGTLAGLGPASETLVGSYGTYPRQFLVALPFFFDRNPGHAIPLCALDKHEVEVVVKIRDVAKLTTPAGLTTDQLQALKIGTLNTPDVAADVYANVDHRNYTTAAAWTSAGSVETTPLAMPTSSTLIPSQNIPDLQPSVETTVLQITHPEVSGSFGLTANLASSTDVLNTRETIWSLKTGVTTVAFDGIEDDFPVSILSTGYTNTFTATDTTYSTLHLVPVRDGTGWHFDFARLNHGEATKTVSKLATTHSWGGVVPTSARIQEGKWYHIIMVSTQYNYVTLYINGVKVVDGLDWSVSEPANISVTITADTTNFTAATGLGGVSHTVGWSVADGSGTTIPREDYEVYFAWLPNLGGSINDARGFQQGTGLNFAAGGSVEYSGADEFRSSMVAVGFQEITNLSSFTSSNITGAPPLWESGGPGTYVEDLTQVNSANVANGTYILYILYEDSHRGWSYVSYENATHNFVSGATGFVSYTPVQGAVDTISTYTRKWGEQQFAGGGALGSVNRVFEYYEFRAYDKVMSDTDVGIRSTKIADEAYWSVSRDLSSVVIDNTITFTSDTEFKCEMPVEYVYLTQSEIDFFKSQKIDYLITQTQVASTILQPNQTFSRLRLNFTNPCKELWVVVQNQENLDANDYFNYSNPEWARSPHGEHLLSMGLEFNKEIRVDPRVADSIFLRYEQTMNHHSRTPTRNVYCYSFSLDPESPDPSGQVNMSRILNKVMELTTTPSTKSRHVKVFARVFNVFRVHGGLGGVLFSDLLSES